MKCNWTVHTRTCLSRPKGHLKRTLVHIGQDSYPSGQSLGLSDLDGGGSLVKSNTEGDTSFLDRVKVDR